MNRDEQGITLGQLLGLVEQAAYGDLSLGTQLVRLLEEMRANASSPPEMQRLVGVLRAILHGERKPDLSELPAEFSSAISQILKRLNERERSGRKYLHEHEEEEEGLTVNELLDLVLQAIEGNQQLGATLFQAMQQMASNPNTSQEMRDMGKTLSMILVGERKPDLSALPADIALEIKELLQKIRQEDK